MTTSSESGPPGVTVIGAGPMGRAIATALLARGTVTVWNRTAAAVAGLRDRGATIASDPADAVRSSPVTLLSLVDHAAVDAVLAAAGPGVTGRTVVGLTSDTPAAARRTADLVARAGGRYVDGAVLTPTSTIGSPDARVLVAGPLDDITAVRPVLEQLGAVDVVGEDVAAAATVDVAALDLFWTAVAGFLHAAQLARAGGVPPRRFVEHVRGIAAILPDILGELAERLADDRHADPSSTIASIRRSVGHLNAAGAAAGLPNATLLDVADRLERADDEGYGADAVTRVAPSPA